MCSIWEVQKDDRLNTDKLDTKTVLEIQEVSSVACISSMLYHSLADIIWCL